MVYGTYNYSIHGVYKPTYNWGAPHCMNTQTFGDDQQPKSAPNDSHLQFVRLLSFLT